MHLGLEKKERKVVYRVLERWRDKDRYIQRDQVGGVEKIVTAILGDESQSVIFITAIFSFFLWREKKEKGHYKR